MKSVSDVLKENPAFKEVTMFVREARNGLKVHWDSIRELGITNPKDYDLALEFFTKLEILSTNPHDNYLALETKRGQIANPRGGEFEILYYFTRENDAKDYTASNKRLHEQIEILKITSS